MDLQQQISTALGRAMADAIPSTPSGSHKILVVGQLVVNITQPEQGTCSGSCKDKKDI